MKQSEALRLPDFLGIGPGRTGTTWLHEALTGHVGLPLRVKETEFFTTYYSRGIEWYASHFRHCRRQAHVGEICPYFGHPKAAHRVHKDIPACRLLITFRDPVARAYSHYKLMRRYVWTRQSFEEMLDGNRQVLESARYASHLKTWVSLFGRGLILIQLYEDLRSQPQAYLDAICDFIGVAPINVDSPAVEPRGVNSIACAPRSRRLAQNARHVLFALRDRGAFRTVNLLERLGVWDFCFGGGEVYAPLAPEVDARVRRRFRPEIEQLEEMIGRDLSAWKETPTSVQVDETDPASEGLGASF